MDRHIRGARFRLPNTRSGFGLPATRTTYRLNQLGGRPTRVAVNDPQTENASTQSRKDASPRRLADESIVCFATAAGFLLTAAICWLNDGAMLPRAAVHAMSFAGCFYLYLGAVGLVSQSIREITDLKPGVAQDTKSPGKTIH